MSWARPALRSFVFLAIIAGALPSRAETTPPATDLIVSPTSIVFSVRSGDPFASFVSEWVSVTNRGLKVDYTVTAFPAWVKVSSSAGTLAENGSLTVGISVDASTLWPGSLSGIVVVSAPGRPSRSVSLDVQVGEPPVFKTITAAPAGLVFTGSSGNPMSPAQSTVTVSNQGPAATYQISTFPDWLQASKSSGSLASNGKDTFTVSANPAYLASGTQTGVITISAPDRQPAKVNVTATFLKDKDLLLSFSSFTFSGVSGVAGSTPLSVVVRVTNQGSDVAYTISPSSAWIVLSKTAGRLPANGQDTFQVSIDATGLPPGSQGGVIEVNAAGRPTRLLFIYADLAEGPPLITAFPSALEFMSAAGEAPPSQGVNVSMGGDQTMDLAIASDSSWLLPAKAAVKTPAAISVSAGAIDAAPQPVKGALRLSVVGSPVITVPVTVRPAGLAEYSGVAIVDGSGLASAVTIVNQDIKTATVALEFYQSQPETKGIPWSPEMVNGSGALSHDIPVGGSFTWTTAGSSDDLRSGWVRVVSQEKISGDVRWVDASGTAAFPDLPMPVNSVWQQRFVTPFDATDEHIGSVFLVNTSTTEPAKVSALFRKETGEVLSRSYRATVPPLGQTQYYFSSNESLTGNRGSAEFVIVGGRVAATLFRYTLNTTVCIEPHSISQPTGGHYSFPLVMDGARLSTDLTVTNIDSVPATVSLVFRKRGASGTATSNWQPSMVNAATYQNVVIAPGSSHSWVTSGTGDLSAGWVDVVSLQKVGGVAIVVQHDTLGSVLEEAAGTTTVDVTGSARLPFKSNAAAGSILGLSNLSATQAATVEISWKNQQGAALLTQTLNLPAQGLALIPPSGFNTLGTPAGVAELTVRTGSVSVSSLDLTPDILALLASFKN